MPPMPPEFYIPAFGALVGALGVLAGVIKVLWNRNLFVADRQHEIAVNAIRVAEATETTLGANTAAIDGATSVLREVRDVVISLADRRPTRPPNRTRNP